MLQRSGRKIVEIWQSFQAGDNESFAYLYNLHLDSLFRYGTKLCDDEDLVKDAIQEIYIDLFLKKERNKTDPENLKFYLILALKRSLIKKIRKQRTLISRDDTNNDIVFEPEYSIEKVIIDRESNEEIAQKINKVLQKLPSRQKEALYLRFNESMEYVEIARILNITVESSRKQVCRALKTVREIMEKETVLFLI